MSLNTKAYNKIKSKLLIENPTHINPFGLWRQFNGFFGTNKFPMRNGVEMKLNLNLSPEHCICNHKTGHITSKKTKCSKPPPMKEETIIESVHTEVGNKEFPIINENAQKSINTTKVYRDSSLLPFVKADGNTVIYVGKECAKHFKNMSKAKPPPTPSDIQKNKSGAIMQTPYLLDNNKSTLENENIKDIIFSIPKVDRLNPDNIIIMGKSLNGNIILNNTDKFGIKDIKRFHRFMFKKGFETIPININDDHVSVKLNDTIRNGIVLANITFTRNGFDCSVKINQLTYF